MLSSLHSPSCLRILRLCLLASCTSAVSACKAAGSDCADVTPSKCINPAPAYSDVEPLISHYCLQCHGPGGSEYASHDFTTYDKVYAQREAMLSQLNSCLMPPFNGPTISDNDRETLLGWLVCDAPQN